MSGSIRILLADDHPIVRRGLKATLEEESDFCVLSEDSNGSEALQQFLLHQPDIAVVDIDMPGLNGLGVARELTLQKSPTRIVFMTFHADEELMRAAMEVGGKGYSLKGTETDEVCAAIRAVHAGRTVISAEIGGKDGTAADDRVKFLYLFAGVRTEPVSKLTPAVAVWSVRKQLNAPANDYRSYDIVVGPGADFPQQIYRSADLQCGAGIDSMQVLVLQRKTLSPEATNGRKCFSDAPSLAAFLRNVPKNDLVILNNFLGRMLNVDTTAIGGTNYAGTNINTSYYNAIGVGGAATGTAYESYQPNNSHTPRVGEQFLPPMVGSLMLDTAMNYFFAPKDFPELKVTPGTGGNCSFISVDESQQQQCVPANSRGAFWIIAIDRLSGIITDHYVLDTNSNVAATRTNAINDLTYLLQAYYRSNDLLAISTVGTPIRANTEVTGALWSAFIVLGGNGFILPKLTASDSTYTLALGAKRDYYKTLLPTAFDLDLFTERADPEIKTYKRDVAIFGGRTCIYPYGSFPVNSYWNYAALFKPNTYDIYILNEKGRNGNHAIPPTSQLVSDVLDPPIISESNYTLSGGAGLIHDDFTRAGADITQRGSYAPGITCTR